MSSDWVPYAMFFATVGLVLVSVGATLVSYFVLRIQVDPEVIVYVQHDPMRPTLLSIVIENIGRGPAYDVAFSVSRAIPANAWGIEKPSQQRAEIMKEGPLIAGIPLLAPGGRRILNWGQYGGLSHALGNEPVRVLATYSSKRRFPWDPTDHATESTLEVESFHRTDASRPADLRQVDALEEIAKQGANISRAFQGIARSVADSESRTRTADSQQAAPQLVEQAPAGPDLFPPAASSNEDFQPPDKDKSSNRRRKRRK